jgi:hypothetical protein
MMPRKKTGIGARGEAALCEISYKKAGVDAPEGDFV